MPAVAESVKRTISVLWKSSKEWEWAGIKKRHEHPRFMFSATSPVSAPAAEEVPFDRELNTHL